MPLKHCQTCALLRDNGGLQTFFQLESLATMDEKASLDAVEETRNSSQHGMTKADKHGDRALAIIGGERVTLTEEEVCCH